MKKTLEVVAACIVKNGLILCALRGYGPLKNKWEFPGGKVELGETQQDALKREIKEELNIDISIDEFLITSHYEYQDFIIDLSVYLASYESGTILDHEHLQLKWVSIDHLLDLDWAPADQCIVLKLIDKFR